MSDQQANNVIDRIDGLLTGDRVGDRTRRFLLSLRSWESKRGLTSKQLSSLASVERQINGPSSKLWAKKYDGSMKKSAEICARYYESNPPYYAELVHQVLNNESFVPSESQFFSLTKNDYSLKVLRAYYKKPKYEVSSYVKVRASCPENIKRMIGDKPCVVIQENVMPIISAAKGAKRYKILPFGSSHSHIVEERYLKKTKIA